MFSHSGSIGGKGIYYALLVSYRGGKTGYAGGTPYDAKSIFIGLEKNWNKNHKDKIKKQCVRTVNLLKEKKTSSTHFCSTFE